MDDRRRRLFSQVAAVVVGVALILYFRGAFSGGDDGGTASPPLGPRGDCLQLALTASSEKAALLGEIAADYNDTDPQVGGECVNVVVTSKSSGATMDALSRGWDERVDGPRPDVWSPAASSWVVLLQQRTASADRPNLVPDEYENVAWSPLVVAMPQPMAEALGWPKAQIGWKTLFDLAQDPAGWGAYGHPEWGAFKLGKTNPNFSTSGLHALVGSYFAATGLSSDLSIARIEEPDVQDFVRGVESSVVHYGDISLTFLANLQRADDRGEGLTYISAVTVEEKSVWDYNQGNPEGDPETLGDHPPPSVPLVAIYPEEGTLVSDHPFVPLAAPWVDDAKREGAQGFLEFLQADEQQERFTEYAFRRYDATPGPLITPANGLLPQQPKLTLDPPAPDVLDRIQRSWEDVRKRARVLILIDVSGSMGESVAEAGASKLELAKEAAIASLDLFAPDDDVGLWVFTTDIDRPGGSDVAELIEVGPLGPNVDRFRREIRGLTPLNGTPLYTAIEDAVTSMRAGLDADRINGVVVLSDGRNEDPRNNDLEGLLRELDSELNVRVFPIAYGADADLRTLTDIAEASRAAVYDASDPSTIDKVFVSVISNF
ncbi:MAG: substrate-binding and vWA domain-containing protein [Actinomycetota bacterium]